MIKEFTYKGYTSLLETALANKYAFISFTEAKSTAEKFCMLRHDVDADLKAAHEMATIEAGLNIKSTYFIMLRSPIYNLFSRSNHDLLKKIINLGHNIGLHFDEAFKAKDKDLNDLINEEALIIEKMFDKKINVVSFHQPGPKIISNEIKISNFINTYDKKDLEGIHYISDSNKVWKNETPWETFETSGFKKLHLLIHPMWWMLDKEDSTENIWTKTIINNLKREQEQVYTTERAYGVKREFIIKPSDKTN